MTLLKIRRQDSRTKERLYVAGIHDVWTEVYNSSCWYDIGTQDYPSDKTRALRVLSSVGDASLCPGQRTAIEHQRQNSPINVTVRIDSYFRQQSTRETRPNVQYHCRDNGVAKSSIDACILFASIGSELRHQRPLVIIVGSLFRPQIQTAGHDKI